MHTNHGVFNTPQAPEDATSVTSSNAKISYRLTPDQAELVLIALYVLDEVTTGSPLPIDRLIDKARWNYEAASLPQDITSHIGHLSDYLFNSLEDSRLTPENRLLAIDPENLTDEEACDIIRDIEAKHGKIEFEGGSHEHTS